MLRRAAGIQWRFDGRKDRQKWRPCIGGIDDPSGRFGIVIIVGVEISLLRTILVIVVVIIVFNNRFLALLFWVGRRRRRASRWPTVRVAGNLASLLFLQLFLLILNDFQLIALRIFISKME